MNATVVPTGTAPTQNEDTQRWALTITMEVMLYAAIIGAAAVLRLWNLQAAPLSTREAAQALAAFNGTSLPAGGSPLLYGLNQVLVWPVQHHGERCGCAAGRGVDRHDHGGAARAVPIAHRTLWRAGCRVDAGALAHVGGGLPIAGWLDRGGDVHAGGDRPGAALLHRAEADRSDRAGDRDRGGVDLRFRCDHGGAGHRSRVDRHLPLGGFG